MITLKLKHPLKAPVDGQCITPDTFAEKPIRKIARLQTWEGNRERNLGQLFKIEHSTKSSSEDTVIRIQGDARKIRRIGARMSTGRIIIDGYAGMHLGEEMEGGTITVAGSAGSWAGCMMENGIIQIRGDAGDYVGAAYRGSTRGMNGGKIVIQGNVGNEVGCFMRKGLIRIHGNVGQFAGIHMKDGTIFVQQNSKGRAGAQMKGGKVVICGHIPSILPSFTVDSVRPKVKVEGEVVEGPFYRFIGDLAERGSGKLFVSQLQNPHLKLYEKYLE
ncbi:MAG: formylmethanofuran dehydrogenase subunit C [Candidatus Bathyarchaeota archaeon]|nr:MAG: formylmethanofuran dehydrogenase subunit C [Candidatus Bathyarchaeota archaeon]